MCFSVKGPTAVYSHSHPPRLRCGSSPPELGWEGRVGGTGLSFFAERITGSARASAEGSARPRFAARKPRRRRGTSTLFYPLRPCQTHVRTEFARECDESRGFKSSHGSGLPADPQRERHEKRRRPVEAVSTGACLQLSLFRPS